MSKRLGRPLKYASAFLELEDQRFYSVSDVSRFLANPQDAHYKKIRACVSHYAKEKFSDVPSDTIQRGFGNRRMLAWFGWRWKGIVPMSQRARLWANAVLERTQRFKSLQTHFPSLARLHQAILQHIRKLKPYRFCSVSTMMKTAQRKAAQYMARDQKSQLLAFHLKGWAKDWRLCLNASFLSPNGAFRGWQWCCCLPETVLSHHQKLQRLIAHYIQERTKQRPPQARCFALRRKRMPFLPMARGFGALITPTDLKIPLQSAKGWQLPVFFLVLWLDSLLLLCSWMLLYHLQSHPLCPSDASISSQAFEQDQAHPPSLSRYGCLKYGGK